jgi:hypothetical protein
MSGKEIIKVLRAVCPELARIAEEQISSLRIGGDCFPHVVEDSFRLGLFPQEEEAYTYHLTVYYQVDDGLRVEEKGGILPVSFSSREAGEAFILALEENRR